MACIRQLQLSTLHKLHRLNCFAMQVLANSMSLVFDFYRYQKKTLFHSNSFRWKLILKWYCSSYIDQHMFTLFNQSINQRNPCLKSQNAWVTKSRPCVSYCLFFNSKFNWLQREIKLSAIIFVPLDIWYNSGWVENFKEIRAAYSQFTQLLYSRLYDMKYRVWNACVTDFTV